MPDIPEDKIRKGEQLRAGRDFDAPSQSQDDMSATRLTPQRAPAANAANPSRDLNPGAMFGKNYQIVALVGKGGMSAVYQAYDRMLKRNVAVKVLAYKRKMDKKARARFVQEGIALSKLDHPNLIKIYEFGDADGAEPYLVMDFLHGVSLSEVMAPGKALPAFRAVSIIKQCVDALRHAHNKGVIHRDLKPSNVMLIENPDTREEMVKIIDFGIAKVDEADSQRLTETGEVFGSPLYMSPEQCRGEKLDERSDMYSLGCMFYELLTGSAPFVGVDFADTVGMHFNDSPKPLMQARPDLDCAKDLDVVINKLMEKARKDRYQTMGDVAEDIEPIFDKLKAAQRAAKAKADAERAAAEAKAAAAAALQEAKEAEIARKEAEIAKKAAAKQKEIEAKKKPKAKPVVNQSTKPTEPLPDIPAAKAKKGDSKSTIKLLAAFVLMLVIVFTAKEALEVYSGSKKVITRAEPIAISEISQPQKELMWWQDEMQLAEKYFDRGNYRAALEHFRKALRTADSMNDDNRKQFMSTTLEEMIDLCYVIKHLNHGKISSDDSFDDASIEYKDALQKLQPVPSRADMLSELNALVKAEGPEIEKQSNLNNDQKSAAVKIAAMSTELAVSAPRKTEANSLFAQANKHIDIMLRNQIPDFAELLIKQAQYDCGIGKSKAALDILGTKISAITNENESLIRDRAWLKYYQACLLRDTGDADGSLRVITESAEDAEKAGPETLGLLANATRELMKQRQKASDRKLNTLLPMLRNQLPRQHWAIAQGLRLSADVDLLDTQAIISFRKKLQMEGLANSNSAAPNDELKTLSSSGEAKLKRAIAILDRSRPYDKREILKAYQALCDIYTTARQLDELEKILPRVLAYAEKIPDFSPLEHAALSHNLGYLKQKKKNYAQAESWYKKALKYLAVSAPPEELSRDVLVDYNSLMVETGRASQKLSKIPQGSSN